MTSPPRGARLCGILCAGLGAVGLVGWIADLPAVRRIGPGLPEMQPNTALGLIACGLSLALPPGRAALARSLAAFAAFIGVVTGVEYGTGRDLGFDDLFLTGTMRMAPQTALSFAATGTALYALRTRGAPRIVQPLALVPISLAYLSLVGLTFAAKMPIFPLATTMALHTAVAFIAVGLGAILAQPERGIVARLRSAGPGGRTLRALLPLVIALPPVLVWTQRLGEVTGAWDHGFGIALQATSTMLVLGIGLLVHAKSLDDAEADRAREAVRFRRIVENTPEGLAVTDAEGRVAYANERLAALLGCEVHEGLSIADCVETPVRGFFLEFCARAARQPTRVSAAVHAEHGDLRFLRFSGTPVPDADPARCILLLVTDETSRRVAEDRLRGHTRALEQATRDLEAYTVLIAHDLREPLRKIQLFADRTSAASPEDPRVLEGLESIRRVAGTEEERVGDLLAYSRLAASVHVPDRVDLGALVHDVARSLAPEIAAVGARLDIGVLPTVEGDADLLAELFRQLFDNALKFRRHGVPLEVRVSSRPLAGGRVELLVEDNGVGFDDADRAHLFAVFRTLHPRARYPGTGIGLAMCRRIVELHGGDIDAAGVPGEGAVFRVRLPVRVLHRVPERCRPVSEPA